MKIFMDRWHCMSETEKCMSALAMRDEDYKGIEAAHFSIRANTLYVLTHRGLFYVFKMDTSKGGRVSKFTDTQGHKVSVTTGVSEVSHSAHAICDLGVTKEKSKVIVEFEEVNDV